MRNLPTAPASRSDEARTFVAPAEPESGTADTTMLLRNVAKLTWVELSVSTHVECTASPPVKKRLAAAST